MVSSGVTNLAFVVDEPVNPNNVEVNGSPHETSAVIILHTKIINLQLLRSRREKAVQIISDNTRATLPITYLFPISDMHDDKKWNLHSPSVLEQFYRKWKDILDSGHSHFYLC